MRIDPRPRQRGFVSIAVLIMLFIMVTLIAADSMAVITLRRQIRALDQQQTRQTQRIAAPTNPPPAAPAPR